MQLERRFIARDGAEIGYEIGGEGPTVVLGHSLLCDGTMWQHVAPRLTERYRVINIDVRGHGTSGTTGPFTLEDLARDWRAILDRERIDRAALVGLSMGGMTAMRLALAEPKRVRGLAILDSSAGPEVIGRRVAYRAMLEIERRAGRVRAFEPILSRLMFGATSIRQRKALVREQIERMRGKTTADLAGAVRAVIDRGDLLPRLGELRMPTLVLVGAEDRATTPDKSRKIAAGIPGAHLILIPRAGHLSALENPTEVLRELEPFLAALPA